MQVPTVAEDEVEFTAMRAQGPGGQNVNKVATAVHLRFDIARSSLPPAVKEKLLQLPGSKVSKEGVLVIKAQSARSQEANKASALARLQGYVAAAAEVQTPRKPTKPSYGARMRRLESKARSAQVKSSRAKVRV